MVITENEGSDLIDPLVDYSCLSLLSRSLNLSSSSSTPNSSIFDSIHAHLKARVLSSPDKMFKQATTILEGSLDLSEAEKTQTVFTENEKVPRERRPALGLRRAKFSVKPMPSQPAVDLEPSIDFDKLTDPEEFFAAFERMENAKKEVQRLKGGPLIDLDLNRGPLAPRRRRPSLLGRSATYTHRPYPSGSTADVDETLLPSQEPIDDEILRPTHYDVVPGATAVDSSSIMRVSDSKATTTSKISELDELLSSNYEGLDEDGVQNLLRDKLQIKSVDIGKASLPDWRVPLHESLTSSSALPKTNDTVFCLSGGNKAVSGKNKQSPANSRSPLASISILNRHIAKRTPSNDLFSCLHFDSSPKKTTSPSSEFEKRVDQVGKSDSVGAVKNLYKFRRSPAHGEEDTAVAGDDTFVSVAKDINLNNEPKDKEVVVGKHDQIGSREDSHEFRRSPAHEEESILVSDIGEPENQENEVAAAQESVRHQLNFEGLMETSNLNEVEKGGVSEPSNTGNHQAFVAVEKGGVSEPSNTGNHPVEELVEQETVGSSKRKLKRKGKSKAPSKAAVSKRTQANTSQSDDPVSGEIRDKRRRVEGARPELSKGERRSSLYCAGTRWDAGVRRSTRIRMRPLEFWKGERFLYGRVHESLVTVIGVKYASPSKEAEGPGVKVKSFVSDKYKDLVELASLH